MRFLRANHVMLFPAQVIRSDLDALRLAMHIQDGAGRRSKLDSLFGDDDDGSSSGPIKAGGLFESGFAGAATKQAKVCTYAHGVLVP